LNAETPGSSIAMCTVSVLAQPGLLRLVSNRDELRSRPAALPPVVTTVDERSVVAPIDTASGGTWIACNDRGLAITLLNVNLTGAAPGVPPRSRGEIVPGLITHHSLDDVARAAAALDTRLYAPFRLVAVQAGASEVLELVPSTRTVRRTPLDAPRMFTSSGLGDARVEGPRRALFEDTVVGGRGGDIRARQDGFHAHRWGDRPELSVWMSRNDAWTVSRTVVEIGEREILMRYAAEPDWIDRPARLPRASAR
jgi:hypothetical protein